MHDNRMTARDLLNYLKDSGYTQQELADALVVSQATISRWDNGLSFPRMKKMKMLHALSTAVPFESPYGFTDF